MKILTTFLAITALSASNYHKNPLATRLQWNSNFGYCGETSYIVAGLYYGQYCSQYTARAIVSPKTPQYDKDSQLLLGEQNALATAAAMHLKVTSFDPTYQTSTDEFLVWIKAQVNAGYPVVIGIFENQYLFYGDTTPSAGDNTYDHIAPVYAISSSHPLSDPAYFTDDRFYISDNGLYTPGAIPTYHYDYAFGECQMNRTQANAKTAPPYSLNNNFQVATDGGNYGIAFLGVLDTGSNTIPVRLTTDRNDEHPSITNGTNDQPTPMPLILTITVTIEDQSQPYNLHYYTSFDSIPTSHFNSSGNPAKTWVIPPNSGSTYTMAIPSEKSGITSFYSNQIAVFRAVPISAP